MDINDLAYRNFLTLGGEIRARVALGDSADDSVRAMWCDLNKDTQAKFSDDYVQFFRGNAKLTFFNNTTSYREFAEMFAQTVSAGCVMVRELIAATKYTYRWPKVVVVMWKPDYTQIQTRFLTKNLLMPIDYSDDSKSKEYLSDIKTYFCRGLVERLYHDDLVLNQAENQFMYANYTRPYIRRLVAVPFGIHFLDSTEGS